ncbi:hypothetical protein MRB53_039094 [Persea americana]|nr:hypothetical protein MRB53_039094 [Persea americana]
MCSPVDQPQAVLAAAKVLPNHLFLENRADAEASDALGRRETQTPATPVMDANIPRCRVPRSIDTAAVRDAEKRKGRAARDGGLCRPRLVAHDSRCSHRGRFIAIPPPRLSPSTRPTLLSLHLTVLYDLSRALLLLATHRSLCPAVQRARTSTPCPNHSPPRPPASWPKPIAPSSASTSPSLSRSARHCRPTDAHGRLLSAPGGLSSVLSTLNYTVYFLTHVHAQANPGLKGPSHIAALAGLLSRTRTSLRLFGLIPIYAWARSLAAGPKPGQDAVLYYTSVAQCALYASYQFFENVSFLTDNKILPPAVTARLTGAAGGATGGLWLISNRSVDAGGCVRCRAPGARGAARAPPPPSTRLCGPVASLGGPENGPAVVVGCGGDVWVAARRVSLCRMDPGGHPGLEPGHHGHQRWPGGDRTHPGTVGGDGRCVKWSDVE